MPQSRKRNSSRKPIFFLLLWGVTNTEWTFNDNDQELLIPEKNLKGHSYLWWKDFSWLKTKGRHIKYTYIVPAWNALFIAWGHRRRSRGDGGGGTCPPPLEFFWGGSSPLDFWKLEKYLFIYLHFKHNESNTKRLIQHKNTTKHTKSLICRALRAQIPGQIIYRLPWHCQPLA